jgi:hydroxymethylpyrimidine/phosphomethylpyrimidine kinase
MTFEMVQVLSLALFDSLPTKTNGEKVSILTKGGHLSGEQSNDLLITEYSKFWLTSKRINTYNSHGTGCTLAAAICAQLALGRQLVIACEKAKTYLNNALAKKLDLGKGNGPLNHLFL